MRKTALLFLISSSIFYSCKNDDVSLPTLFVTPSNVVQTVVPGEIVNFSINLEAEGGLDKFEITESVDGGSQNVILDTAFSDGTNSDITYSYNMPNSKQSLEIIIAFKLYDNLGEVATGSRKLIINPSDSLLPELKGVTIYSGNSTNRNAYFIESDSVAFSDSVFLTDIDILCSDTSDTLSLNWSSPIGNKFVVFNGFNYDSASYKTMTEAYQLGNELSVLTELEIGDIIITKLNSPLDYDYALIKLTNVVDDIGSINDKYVFSIKK